MAGAQRPGHFRPGELDAADLGPGAEAELLGTARELEWLAASEDVGPGPGFADRVMAAVSRDPAPRPVAAALGAARRRSPLAALAALGDLWRVAFTGGRPFAVRLPAMALVALLVLGSVGAGALGAGALAGLLGRTPDATPALSPSPLVPSSPPEPTASPSASASPSVSPAASESAEPSGAPEPSESPEPSDTLEPIGAQVERPAATGDHAARPTGTPSPTSRPTHTPEAPETPGPTQSPGPSESSQATPGYGGGSGGG
jgi:hypothetical protein